jgi:hypothetical protein
MRINKSTTIPMPYNMTAFDLISVLERVPKSARVSVYTSQGDRPWESDSHRLEVTWTEEV